MLLVKTKVRPSNIHGLGLFAGRFIPKGTEIWKFTPGFDLKFTREQLLALPKLVQVHVYKYGWRSKKSDLYLHCADDGKFFNHSEDPNCLSEYRDGEEEAVVIAIRDIRAGEEMTDNYDSFAYDRSEGDVLAEIAKKYRLVDELDPRFKKELVPQTQTLSRELHLEDLKPSLLPESEVRRSTPARAIKRKGRKMDSA